MSLETWLKEFYPVKARDVAKEDAAAHSLKKWEGLKRDNLRKHKVIFKDGMVHAKDNHIHCIEVNSSTCVLCIHYIDGDGDDDSCPDCPLCIALGECCDTWKGGVYGKAINFGNIRPMLRGLRKAVELTVDGKVK